jgi:Predicted metal-dependent hydrolase
MNEQRVTVAGIEATVLRKSVKNLRVTIVPPDGAVRVSAPKRMPEALIRAFLLEKADWIRTHAAAVRAQHRDEPRQFASGETVRVFGSVYTLLVLDNQKKNGVAADADCLIFSVKPDTSAEQRKALLNEWLRERLKAEIEHFLPLWSHLTGLAPSGWTVRDMTSRWGSCNTKTGKITLNLQLSHCPLPCLEYVILHELCHLRVRGHGPDFKALLDQFMPDWKARKKLLNA